MSRPGRVEVARGASDRRRRLGKCRAISALRVALGTVRRYQIDPAMTSSREIRSSFLEYFKKHGHEIVPSGPLVPPNDPTLMFANAGMVQFKDVFTGKDRRPYTRATSSQKCIRISGKHNDLENVGVTARHHTFFEMLGNFSFGDYFKRDAIRYAWGYFTEVLKLDPNRIVITVFGGEPGYGPADDEAAAIWKDVTGFPDERIIRLGKADNFWQMGDTGPCGPCTELHYCLGMDTVDISKFGEEPTPDGRGWFEIWNVVFMQFDRQPDGTLVPLPAPSVDTGAGLERVAVVAQGVLSNYDTDLLRPIVDIAAKVSGKKYGASTKPDDVSMRVIADHARLTAMLISEGITPAAAGRGYVLRRVMRRAIRHGHKLGIGELFLHHAALEVSNVLGDVYPQLREREALIADVVQQEEKRFRDTMKRGLDLLDENTDYREEAGKKILPGPVAFKLYDTYGFPLDLQEVIGEERGFAIDHEAFQRELAEAKTRSKGSKLGEAALADVYPKVASEVGKSEFLGYEHETGEGNILAILHGGERVGSLIEGEEGEIVASRTPFYPEKGGQVGDRGVISIGGSTFAVEDTLTPVDGLVIHRGRVTKGTVKVGDAATLEVDHALRSATRRNHSATHLMHYGLRTVVGPTAMQKGSLVGPDRLRFDYSSGRALTDDEIRRIEDIVNEAILANEAITTETLPMDEAKARGAIGIFEEKYGDVVRMLRIGPSLELCGGTHAYRTGDIGLFKILSDGNVAAGVRRIEATTGLNALAYLRSVEGTLERTATLVKTTPSKAVEQVERVLETQRELRREIDRLKKQLMSGGSKDLTAEAKTVGDVKVLGAIVDIGDAVALRELSDQLRDKLAPAVILLGSKTPDGKVVLACSVSKELTKRFPAGPIVKKAAEIVGGGGGGRPDFAQAGGTDPSKLEEAVAVVYTSVTA